MPVSFFFISRARRMLLTLLLLATTSSGVFAESVSMIYVIREQKLPIMATDITQTRIGRMRQLGDPLRRLALRICFSQDMHARILEFVTKNLEKNDYFKIIIDCKVVVDLRIVAFHGEGNCNFIYSEDFGDLVSLEESIKSGMTNATCEAYVS